MTNVGRYPNNFSVVRVVATFPGVPVGRALPDGHFVYVCIELKLHILNLKLLRKNGKRDRKITVNL